MRYTIAIGTLCLGAVVAASLGVDARQPSTDDAHARALALIKRGRQSIGPVASVVSLSAVGINQSTAETAPGTERPAELHLAMPDKFVRTVAVLLPGANEIRRLAWGVNGTTLLNGPRGMGAGHHGGVVGDPATERRAFWRLLLGWLLLEPPGVPFTYSFAGEAATSDGARAWLVDVTGPDELAVRLFLDRATCRPLMLTYSADPTMLFTTAPGSARGESVRQLSRPDGRVAAATFFSDVRRAGAFQLPHLTIDTRAGVTVQQFRVDRFAINPSLKPALFELPQ